MTWAELAVILCRTFNSGKVTHCTAAIRHTAKMGANAHHHQKLLFASHHTVCVRGRITVLDIEVARNRINQISHRYSVGRINLWLGAMAHKNRITAPLQRYSLTFSDGGQIHLN